VPAAASLGHRGIRGLGFGPRGETLVVCGADGAITQLVVGVERMVELLTELLRRNLTRAEWERYLGTPYAADPPLPQLPFEEDAAGPNDIVDGG
jgi:hypothetical protein